MGDIGTTSKDFEDTLMQLRGLEYCNYNIATYEALGYRGLQYLIAYHDMKHDYDIARSYAQAKMQEEAQKKSK